VEFILFLFSFFFFLFSFSFFGFGFYLGWSFYGCNGSIVTSTNGHVYCFSSGTHTTFMDPTHEFYCTFLLCKDIYPFRRVRLLLNKKKKKITFLRKKVIRASVPDKPTAQTPCTATRSKSDIMWPKTLKCQFEQKSTK
jgi:hypothetical protein